MKNILKITLRELPNIDSQLLPHHQLVLLEDSKKIKEGDYVFENIALHDHSIVYLATEENLKYWIKDETTKDNFKRRCSKVVASYPKMEGIPTFTNEFIEEWLDNPVAVVEVEYKFIEHTAENGHVDAIKVIEDHVVCHIGKKEFQPQ